MEVPRCQNPQQTVSSRGPHRMRTDLGAGLQEVPWPQPAPGTALCGLCREDIEGALEVAGDSREVDLDGGFDEASPSHSAHAVRLLPRSEDFLHGHPYRIGPMDRLVPFPELMQPFLLVTAPHAAGDDPRYAAGGLLASGVPDVGPTARTHYHIAQLGVVRRQMAARCDRMRP